MDRFDNILSSILKKQIPFKVGNLSRGKKGTRPSSYRHKPEIAQLAHKIANPFLNPLPITCIKIQAPLIISFENIEKSGQSEICKEKIQKINTKPALIFFWEQQFRNLQKKQPTGVQSL